MNTFEMRVRAAASAGGLTLLATAGVLVLQWLVSLAIFSARPAWFLDAIGHVATWDEIASVWLQMIATLKVFFWIQAALVLWTALWAARLRKASAAPIARETKGAPLAAGAANPA
jgi:hypothetical protein